MNDGTFRPDRPGSKDEGKEGNISDESEITKERVIKFRDLEIGVQADFSKIITELNLRLGITLAARPEGFHVTVIRPTERKALRYFSEKDVKALREMLEEIKEGKNIKVEGIGYIDGSKSVFRIADVDRNKKTAFIALDIPRMNKFRQRMGLVPKDFHITLGFENGDIHEEITGQEEHRAIPKKSNPEFNDLIPLIPELKFTGFTDQSSEIPSDTSQETKEGDSNVEELKKLVNDPDFRDQFLSVQTRAEVVERNKVLNSNPNGRDYVKRLTEAEKSLGQAREVQLKKLEQLKKELKIPTKELVVALNAWARSRNSKGETGADQKGFNAGVIHYFEYRAHASKNRKRFKPEHSLSIKGFVEHTKYYEGFLKNPNPAGNPEIETAKLLEDSTGNRRLYILTKDGDFIVGFQKAGGEMKILSVSLERSTESVSKTIEKELSSVERREARFNRLEGPVKEVLL